MSASTFPLKFKGYWPETLKAKVPARSGVYCVYACLRDEANKSVRLRRLLYVGGADDVRGRIAAHEGRLDWERHLEAGAQLCYTFAAVGAGDRARCEAALVGEHNPPCNAGAPFAFDATELELSGKIKFLTPRFMAPKAL